MVVTRSGAGNDGPYDLVLQDQRDTPNTVLGFVLYAGDSDRPDEEPVWRESRAAPLSERRSSGELTFNHRDPTYDLVLSQTDWSGGALQTYYDSADPNRYSQSDNMDLRFGGVASLGPLVSAPSATPQVEDADEWTGHVVVQGDDDDELYATAGESVFHYNRTTSAWAIVFSHPSDTHATDITELNGTVYVAFGDSAYYYFTGTGSWTASDLGDGTQNQATYFVRARNATGAWVLWKSVGKNQIQWNDDPTSNQWQPESPFTVGDSDRTITNLYGFRDTFIIGKTDGLWIWDPQNTDFALVTPEWDNDVSPENGRIGQVWHRDLYVTAAQQGFFRYSLDVLEDLSNVISAPRLPDVGGRVSAMAGTTRDLLLALEQSKPDTDTTKRAHLARMHLSVDGSRWQVHTVALVAMREVQQIIIDRGEVVWALGTLLNGQLGAVSWQEPIRDIASFADPSAPNARLGWFETGVWHGGVPDAFKALLAMTIWADGVDGSHPITLSMGRDGAPSDTDAVGIFNLPRRVQTIFFENMPNHIQSAICRFGQFRFTFESSDDTPPRLYAYELHSQAFFRPIRVWNVRVVIEGLLRTGVEHPLSKAEIEAAYAELEEQVFPIIMTENLGGGRGGPGPNGERLVRLVDYHRVELKSAEGAQEVWQLTLQEALPYIA